MNKSRLKNVIYIILLLLIPLEIMSTKVFAAELELESKYGSGNPYKFEISETWTSKGQTIKSYDVSEQGQIAIAFSNHTIGVFDNDMNFLYQLSFETNGTYGVLWLDEKLVFIEIRSETAVVCDGQGMPEAFYKITAPSNYLNRVVDKRVRKRGSDEYHSIKKGGFNAPDSGMFYGSYDILKRTSQAGGEEILYEADESLVWKERLEVWGTVVFLLGMLIVSKIISRRKKKCQLNA